jgi:hypothetical protein
LYGLFIRSNKSEIAVLVCHFALCVEKAEEEEEEEDLTVP